MTQSQIPGVRGPEQIGEYRVVRRLGMGGQGAVFLAESPTGTRVAIKLLHERFAADPDDRRRFLREAQVAATVAPFCTARVLGTGLFGEQPYIVSEYVPGPSLQELVRTEGPRTGGGLHRLAISTLTALSSIHRAGIVHRDFKPANVILGPEGPVVIDFGIARAMGAMTTATSSVSGTPAFMSPELLTDQPATPASDIFSWGVTMVFAATGRVPFSGENIPATFHAILNKDPDLTGVPEPLRTLVAACLAKNPANRPAADHLLRELTTAKGLADAPMATPGHPPAGMTGQASSPMPGHTAIGMPDEMVSGTTADTMPPAASFAPTAGLGARRRQRRTLLISGAVLAAAVVGAGAVFLPSPLGRGGRPAAEQPSAQAAPVPSAASPTPRPALDLTAYSVRDVIDDFNGTAGAGGYIAHQPFSDEALPKVKGESDRFVAEGQSAYYGWFSLPGSPASGDTVTIITLGSFAETGKPEDSVFTGRIKDRQNYIGAWYNNTRKQVGIDLVINGRYRHTPNAAAIQLQPGDRLALVVSASSGTITSYAESGGVWRRLTSIKDVAGAEDRSQWLHGFGLRASQGTVSLDDVEGRSIGQ